MQKLIDAKGKTCPIPVVMARNAIMEGDDAFIIEVDNATAVENLKRLAASQSFSVDVREQSGTFALRFTRLGTDNTVDAAAAPAAAQLPAFGSYAVLVGRDILGAGDRTLGTNLMRMFFYTLAASEHLPDSVLFLNDGVKLPTLDDQVVEHLNALTALGVEVLVCGTCLNFYSLSDQLRAGTVSNMFDILTKLQEASKVISL